jgi:hypothetical protein
MFRTMKPLVFVVIVLFMATLACSLPGVSNTAKATPTLVAKSEPAGGTATKTPTPQGGITGSTGDTGSTGELGSFSDLNQGLDSLNSYQMQYTFAFEGKDDQGNSAKGSVTGAQEVIKASSDSYISFEATGDAASSSINGKIETYQIGQNNYIVTVDAQAKPQCTAFSFSELASQNGMIFKPSDFLTEVKDAKLVKKGETVNEVKADHYQFDQSNLPSSGYSAASGDIWIAQEGSYIVKYTGKATGSSSIFGSGIDVGDMTWDYSLTNINAITAIKPPENCTVPGLTTDIPVPPNTKVDSSYTGLTALTSTDDTKTVADFYRKTLPSQDWKVDTDNAVGDIVMISFTKAARKLSIIITPGDAGGCTVLVSDSQG